LTRVVEIVGEAANYVDLEVQRAHPEVPWRQIIGPRHRITHGYFDIDLDTLWEVVAHALPEVLPHIRVILKGLPSDCPDERL
jgi:uncharacterized protein with HEPN domain